MISLTTNYNGNALTRAVKRTSQKLAKTRLRNARDIAFIAALGVGAGAGISKLAGGDIWEKINSIIIVAASGSIGLHYILPNDDREKAKYYLNELNKLKSSDEYQKILERAKAIKQAKQLHTDI